jgi:hypothetical protein
MPAPRGGGHEARAAYLERQVLQALLARLQALPLDLMLHGNRRERARADAIAVAIEHIQAAIEALELAAQQ